MCPQVCTGMSKMKRTQVTQGLFLARYYYPV